MMLKEDLETLLKEDGPVAIVIRQDLAPVNEADPVIFPPTYPVATFRGRVHTVLDGDYRVSVELPGYAKTGKTEKMAEQSPGYNIDRFPDGTNICEIDSPQSQANRIEPEFKKLHRRDLVPQIRVRVGTLAAGGAVINLLDAGHRAADAVVRLSSLAAEFHAAFSDSKAGNDFTLATLAPTSLLFGVWDSRSTQVKMQRILKASIRATNVRECTRSAQFTPAVDYKATEAIGAECDEDALSSEGMKHALAVQKVGGVLLTPASQLRRTVTLNLVALRGLRAPDISQAEALQRYILGLALVAATGDADLNLREGCNLRFKDNADNVVLIPRRGEPVPVVLDTTTVMEFATTSARRFFEVAGIPFEEKDHLDAVFEAGIAEEFLGLKADERDKVRSLGPITAATLKRLRDAKSDPFKALTSLIRSAKDGLPKKAKGQTPVVDPEKLKAVFDSIRLLSEDPVIPDSARAFALELTALVKSQTDPMSTLGQVEAKVRAFKKSQRDSANGGAAEENQTS